MASRRPPGVGMCCRAAGVLSAVAGGGEEEFPGLECPQPSREGVRKRVGGERRSKGTRGAVTRPALERPQVNEACAGGRAPLGAGLSPVVRAPGAAFSAGCHSGVGRMAHSKAPRGGPVSALQ